jgi:hypothetical protein
MFRDFLPFETNMKKQKKVEKNKNNKKKQINEAIWMPRMNLQCT